MTKNNTEDFENSTECWICDNDFVDNDVKVRDHCHMTGKDGGSTHRDCNINVKISPNTAVVFHNLKVMMHILMSKN